MLKPSGNFSLAVGSLSTAVAIGSAGTGANFASAALLGAPCIQEGGAAGACAEGAGAGLVNGCDPGPAPGWAEGGTGGWGGGDRMIPGRLVPTGRRGGANSPGPAPPTQPPVSD